VKSAAKKYAMVGKPITWGLKLNHSPSLSRILIDRECPSLAGGFSFENHQVSRPKVKISNFYSKVFEIFIKRSNFCLYLSVIILFLMLRNIIIRMTIGSS
jgi:hypothetical protein